MYRKWILSLRVEYFEFRSGDCDTQERVTQLL